MKASEQTWAIWSRPQRRAISLLLLGLLIWWGYKAYENRAIIGYPQTGPGARAEELEDTIDPNTASAAELAALPVIGPSVAAKIVAYRKKYRADGRPGAAFEQAEDLLKVSGIGYNTVQQIKPYLRFTSNRELK